MLHYTKLQLITVIIVPIAVIVLLWTVGIFQQNRKRWRCYDSAVVAILLQSVVRDVAIVVYTILQVVNSDSDGTDRFNYCVVFVWILSWAHTFQASTLTTLAVIALFSARLSAKCKGDRLRNYLTTAHVVYHLFCLTTLCACVGVAAVLATDAQTDTPVNLARVYDPISTINCKFMPYEMDVKYNVFMLTLHVFLALVSLVSLASAGCYFYTFRRGSFNYLNKSNSDLSELSLRSANNRSVEQTTTTGTCQSYFEAYSPPVVKAELEAQNRHALGNVLREHPQPWNSDMSNISTTVSSTNSRRPCISKAKGAEEDVDAGDPDGIGLDTILPVLMVCYLFNHVPIIILCIFPWVLSPWSVSNAALCLGLLQDILVPLSLSLVDTRFCQWVSHVYHCTDRNKLTEKLPQVGLDGKFRPFCNQGHADAVQQNDRQRSYQTSIVTTSTAVLEPKFPITNGSLYTSIDGRLPIIHNYRRHKEKGGKLNESNLNNLGAHATYIKQHEQQQQQQQYQPQFIPPAQKLTHSCSNCEDAKHKPQHHGLNVTKVTVNANATPEPLDPSFRFRKPVSGQDIFRHITRTRAKKPTRGDNLRLSKSEDSLLEVARSFRNSKLKVEFHSQNLRGDATTDSEDDYYYYTDSMDLDLDAGPSFDSCSITTEANCDFDFFQVNADADADADVENNNAERFGDDRIQGAFEFLHVNAREPPERDPPKVLHTFKPQLLRPGDDSNDASSRAASKPPDVAVAWYDINRNFKIKRSNSKRSLESFRAFVTDNGFPSPYNEKVVHHKSYSYLTLDADAGENDGLHDAFTLQRDAKAAGGSVPDLKKIFISEYL